MYSYSTDMQIKSQQIYEYTYIQRDCLWEKQSR